MYVFSLYLQVQLIIFLSVSGLVYHIWWPNLESWTVNCHENDLRWL